MANYSGSYGGGYQIYDSGNETRLNAEISQLRFELNEMKKEMTEMKKLMSARASFTDFKVFKFNEEEEKRKIENERVERTNALYNLRRVMNR